MSELQTLLEEGVRSAVFPSAQAVVLHKGARVFSGAAGGVNERTVFDLASLTKVMSTTALVLSSWAEGKLGPETKVSRFFPDSSTGKSNVTLADLLFHRSGLPAFVPYFARVMPAVPELFDDKTPRKIWDEVHAEILHAAFSCSLRRGIAEEVVYSDVGFIQLGEILSRAHDLDLDALFETRVAKPLGLSARFRRISSHLPNEGIAETGGTRPREAAPGQETMWQPFPLHPSRAGEVDDDNAWVLDGVAGHAGLFGTADDVARFGQAVLDELGGKSRLAPAPLWSIALTRDSKTPNSSRTMGFDTPTPPSSAGLYFGEGAFGHLGFTGTSLWVDRKRQLVVALLTNRVLRGRGNLGIRQFRPRFHDAVIETLTLT